MRSHRKSGDRLRREMAADQWKRFMRGAGAQSLHLFSPENPSRDRTAVTAFHSASEGDVKTLIDIEQSQKKENCIGDISANNYLKDLVQMTTWQVFETF